MLQKGHFTFNNETYLQREGVMMGFPLGSLIAKIFMCNLEMSIISNLCGSMKYWTRYVDDTFALIKPNEIESVLKILNDFHESIQFTYELERERKLTFLDVQIERINNNDIQTSVYRKMTNSDLYMNWKSYSPKSWKIGTLRNLVKRALIISSTQELLETELDHLTKVFIDINNYPNNLTKSIITNEVEKYRTTAITSSAITPSLNNESTQVVQLNLPYGGEKGENLVKKLKRDINKTSKGKIVLRATYTPHKLGSNFTPKDKTKFAHQHNVTYHVKCPNRKCSSQYTGQTNAASKKEQSNITVKIMRHIICTIRRTPNRKE